MLFKTCILHLFFGVDFEIFQLNRIFRLHDNNSEFYTGLTSRSFKKRLYEHRTDSNNAARRTKTALSGHVWDLKDNNRTYNTTWNIMDRAPPYNPITKKCRLCLKEKFYIMYTPQNATLNKRDEIWTPCRHRFKDLISQR